MKLNLFLTTLTAVGLFTTAAQAQTIYGLTGTGGLISFDATTPGTVTSIGSLQSTATAGDTIRSIDFRQAGSPGGPTLYAIGVAADNQSAQIYTVNFNTGAMTPAGARFTLAGNTSDRITIDFNPAADRVRIITGSGNSYRWNPQTSTFVQADTTLTYAVGGGAVAAGGIAYSQNFQGTAVTTLFGYDTTTNNLVTIGGLNGNPSPNGGVTNIVGNSGIVSFNNNVAMDIGAFLNPAFAAVNISAAPSDTLFRINLLTGAFTSIGLIGGGENVIGITVTAVPEPATVLAGVFAVGGVLVAARRRKQQQTVAQA